MPVPIGFVYVLLIVVVAGVSWWVVANRCPLFHRKEHWRLLKRDDYQEEHWCMQCREFRYVERD